MRYLVITPRRGGRRGGGHAPCQAHVPAGAPRSYLVVTPPRRTPRRRSSRRSSPRRRARPRRAARPRLRSEGLRGYLVITPSRPPGQGQAKEEVSFAGGVNGGSGAVQHAARLLRLCCGHVVGACRAIYTIFRLLSALAARHEGRRRRRVRIRVDYVVKGVWTPSTKLTVIISGVLNS